MLLQLIHLAPLLPHAAIRSSSPRLILDDSEADLISTVGGSRAATLGEMTHDGFGSLQRYLRMGASDRFVDLGSGEGTLVLQAAAETGVAHASGIELAESRHQTALAALDAAPNEVQARVTFVCGDAAGEQAVELLSPATVIWCSNLLFDDALQRRLALRIASAPRVRAVAVLKPFPDGIHGFVESRFPAYCRMSWDGDHTDHPCPVYLRG
jgi:hypothetical protein